MTPLSDADAEYVGKVVAAAPRVTGAVLSIRGTES